MGSVRTQQIKRAAKELLRLFPDKFSNDFEHNKRMVGMLTRGATVKVRNQIAGYITHALSGIEMASSKTQGEEKG